MSDEILYLEERLETAKSRLARCQASVTDYMRVATELANFANVPRRQVLTPVCNGLAYFDAVVENTNSLMVLLGDGWFAERSATQSAEIAQRRLQFLKDEEKMLQGQVKQAEETIRIANDEARSHQNTKTTATKKDHKENESDDDTDDQNRDNDSDSFDSCDDLNLRELEDLEDEMVRSTGGGEWSSEVLRMKVRERKKAKQQRRLNEEAKAQRTVAEIMIRRATRPTQSSEGIFNGDHNKEDNVRGIPKHPGEIGIIEQLEQLNRELKVKKQEEHDENDEIPDLKPPTNASHQNQTQCSSSSSSSIIKSANGEIMIPIDEFNRRMAAVTVNNQSGPTTSSSSTEQDVKVSRTLVADGTGGVIERNSQTSSAAVTPSVVPGEKPKTMSLFKQRKQQQ